ncbi:MFS transporter [Tardiphaga sp.]|jgi:DHA2 family multidrug resistance protein|uniref:MFS transporter n=1 Tax=Tardiphaga sp. TaxID=1926292 RepID=UPI0037DA4844
MAQSNAIESGPVSTGALAPRPIFAVGAVLLGSFLANFDSRLFLVALPDLRGAFSLGFDQASWLGTATTAMQILIAPAVAWLATAFGLRRVLGIPSLVYATVSLLMPLMQDYSTLMALNILRGLLLGTFVPATLMIIFRNLPMRWWLPAIAIYGIRVGFSLNFGVAMVGFYESQWGWQWLFWQDVVIAPLMGLFVYLGTPAEPIDRALVRNADWGGMLLLGAGMAMIYAGLDQGNRLDWFSSGTVTVLLGGGALLAVLFLINEAVVAHPWAEARVILSRNIGLNLVMIVLYALTGLSNAALVPNFLLGIAGLRAEQIGPLFLFAAALPMLIMLPLSVIVVRIIDARYVLMIGLLAFFAAGLLGTRLTHEWAAVNFIPLLLLQAVGQTFSLLPIILITLANSNPQHATAFAAYIQVVRLGGAEIGVALMATWLRVREQVHSNLLGQHVANGSTHVTDLLARLTAGFTPHGVGEAGGRAMATLAGLVQREANVLAYIDGFWLTTWCAVVALIVLAGITAAPPGPFSPHSQNR